MSDDRDAQDLAEALDADKLPGDEGVLGDEGSGPEPDFPLDVPLGVDDDTVTPRMEQVRESVEDRTGREEPDPLAAELDRRSHDEDSAPSGPVEGAVVGTDGDPDRGAGDLGAGVGHLVEPGDDDVLDAAVDDEATAVAADAGGDPAGADLSAEEAAVHLTGDPPLGTPGDGYLGDG